MRAVLGVTVVSFLTLSGFLFFGQSSVVKGFDPGQYLHNFLNRKEINLVGNSYLTEGEIKRFLPFDRSAFWWAANRGSLEQGVARHNLINSVKIGRCSTFSLHCYTVQVQEKEPIAAVVREGRLWVVGEDGSFLYPVRGETLVQSLKSIAVHYDRVLPILELDLDLSSSTQTEQGRLLYGATAIEAVRIESQLEPEYIKIRKNGELEMRFFGYDFMVIFDRSFDQTTQLNDEVKRLNVILTELGDQLNEIEKIDLAFDRLGVVTFVEK